MGNFGGRAAVLAVVAAGFCTVGLLSDVGRPALAGPGTADSAEPKPFQDEKDYVAKLDAALRPIRDLTIPAADAQLIRDAIQGRQGDSESRYAAAIAAIKDPAGRKLVAWARLRSGLGQASEYIDFLSANPLWPDRTLLKQRLEAALFNDDASASAVKAYFKTSPPETGTGTAALAAAALTDGDSETAKTLARKAWREMTIPASLEAAFLKRFGKLLSEADHKWRFDRMTTDDVRYAANRTERSAAAKRIIPLLGPTEQKRAAARLAVFNKSSNAKALMAAAGPGDAGDTGLAFHRAQLLRKSGKIAEAAKIILSFPPDPAKIAELDEWWAERRMLAYGALKDGDAKLAYSLVKDAGPLSVNPLKEQTFMAGWIALRYLKNPDAAEKHFKNLTAAADGPLSRAKAAYWLARVAETRGDKSAAAGFYKTAAKDGDTFHGLLAMQQLDPKRTAYDIKPPAFPSTEQIANFITLDAVKAVVIARKAGLSREYTRGFLTSLRLGLASEAEAAMVAHLADAIGDTQMSLRVAKAAIAKGQNLMIYGYPLHPFPAYTPLRKPPELPFLLGIARQETEFESQTVSGAGAKGLLQVMTETAQHICHDYKFKCEIPRLLSDDKYNVTIASAYIADRMDEFSGSYVLGLAGYNAGPGRARQWIRENGDPRDPKVDPLDWIERIPITETREYVTKVLANIQVYRARTGNAQNALRIGQDLMRARGQTARPAPANSESANPVATERSDG